MKVLKFGGTSVANSNSFLQVLKIVSKAAQFEQVAVVLSAPATITNSMIALTQNAIDGISNQASWEHIYKVFDEIIDGLEAANPKFDKATIATTIKDTLTDIADYLSAVEKLKQCPDEIKAIIYSTGENLSIAILGQLLLAEDKKVTKLSPLDVFLAEGSFLESDIDIVQSTQRYNSLTIDSDSFVLLPGFYAANEQGKLILLGRNGSDYSAACLAAISCASSCEIWTDVDGVYTCDPNIVRQARLLAHLNYREAMELSYFGAKVLHPKSIGPLVPLNIPCYIKNTKNPDFKGTVINGSYDTNDEIQIKGITNYDNIVMFNISGSAMKGTIGMASRIFAAVSSANVSVILITQSSSEYSISFCVNSQHEAIVRKTLQDSLNELFANGGLDPIDVSRNLSIISVVGDGMKTTRGISAAFFRALAHANINIVAIAQGSSERSISTVVKTELAIKAIKATHQALFNKERRVNLFLLGYGLVGKELIKQISNQQEHLKHKNIVIQVNAIANSKKALLDSHGIDVKNFDLNNGVAYSYNDLVNYIKEHNIINPVIVDCTSSQEVSDFYYNFLDSGVSVVTANKKANTMDYDYYRQLRKAVVKQGVKFLYDTNVGAGLPVIENLQNQIAAGDSIKTFNGILSGSLSYIFGELDSGTTLSQAVNQAKEKGFTEPDPRDDLSGMDVARKLLIIARESGLQIELDDIEINSVLPVGFAEGLGVDEFMAKLPELDQEFSKLSQQAKDNDQVLRYVGIIENGKCSVQITPVSLSNPLANVKAGENALTFYTRYYNPIPLLLRGYGAGSSVTAAGLFGDILRCLSSGSQF